MPSFSLKMTLFWRHSFQNSYFNVILSKKWHYFDVIFSKKMTLFWHHFSQKMPRISQVIERLENDESFYVYITYW